MTCFGPKRSTSERCTAKPRTIPTPPAALNQIVNPSLRPSITVAR